MISFFITITNYNDVWKPIIEISTMIFLAAAFVYQARMIHIQRKEFERQKEKDSIQIFESVFFNLLDYYDKTDLRQQSLFGATSNFYEDYFTHFVYEKHERKHVLIFDDFESYVSEKKENLIKTFEDSNIPLYLINNVNILSDIFDKIESLIVFSNKSKDLAFKKFYFKLFYSRMTPFQLYVFFVYNLTNIDDHKTHKKHIEKYSLFEGLIKTDYIFPIQHLYKASAFKSNI